MEKYKIKQAVKEFARIQRKKGSYKRALELDAWLTKNYNKWHSHYENKTI